MIPTVAHSLRARHDGGEDGTGRGTPLVPSWPAEVAPTLNAAFGTKQGLEDQHALGGAGCFVPALPITFHNRQDPDASGDITHPLGAKDNGLGYPAVLAPTLTATNDPSRSPQSSEITAQVAAVVQATAAVATFQQSSMAGKGTIGYETSGTAKPVKTQVDGQMLHYGMAVRRLTPVECERLQGFPDGYTDIRSRGKDTPDGPRYKALGNSMAVPVMRWIGERIAAVDKL